MSISSPNDSEVIDPGRTLRQKFRRFLSLFLIIAGLSCCVWASAIYLFNVPSFGDVVERLATSLPTLPPPTVIIQLTNEGGQPETQITTATWTPSPKPPPTFPPTWTPSFTPSPSPIPSDTPVPTPTTFAQIKVVETTNDHQIMIYTGSGSQFVLPLTGVNLNPAACTLPDESIELVWQRVEDGSNWFDIYHARLVKSDDGYKLDLYEPIVYTVAAEFISLPTAPADPPVWSRDCSEFRFTSKSQWGTNPPIGQFVYNLTNHGILDMPQLTGCTSGYRAYTHPELLDGLPLELWMCNHQLLIAWGDQATYPIGYTGSVRVSDRYEIAFPEANSIRLDIVQIVQIP